MVLSPPAPALLLPTPELWSDEPAPQVEAREATEWLRAEQERLRAEQAEAREAMERQRVVQNSWLSPRSLVSSQKWIQTLNKLTILFQVLRGSR